MVRDKIKDFIDDFYSYDFTGILYNDESSDVSDTELVLESADLVKDDNDKEVDKEITNPLTQQEAACSFIDEELKS